MEEEANEAFEMIIESPSFKDNEMMPAKYTCAAENINPALIFSGIPSDRDLLMDYRAILTLPSLLYNIY